MSESPADSARAWRLVELGGIVISGIAILLIMVINLEFIVPVLVFGVGYFAVAAALWHWIDRQRVALVAAVLALLGFLANIPFFMEDLSHIGSWGRSGPVSSSPSRR